MKLTAYYDAATNAVQVRMTTDAAPGGAYVKLVDIVHEALDNLPGAEGRSISHRIYQHIQDALYLNHGVQNMQLITISTAGTYVALQRVFVDQGMNRLGYGIENTVTVTLDPANATNDGITFVVSNPDLVTVVANTGNGVFTFKGPNKGNVFIRVRVNDFEQNIPVEFTDELEPAIAATSITIAPAVVTLTVAAPTQQLTPTVLPANASNKGVTYVSSDPTKATVSATGLVTRVANGTTNITVTAKDGSGVNAVRLVTCTA